MYDIITDIYYTNFINAKNLSEASKANYEKTLRKLSNALNITLEEIINNCKNQQNLVIEKTISQGTDEQGNQIIEKRIIQFDINSPESLIKQYFDTYISYCKNRNNTNNTISIDLDYIKTFLKFYSVDYPKTTIKRETTNWNLLTKEDINFIMADSTLTHQSLISLLKDTGLRLNDALNLTLGQFMESTTEYHNYIDVNEFIDKAPDDMIGILEIYPQKTKRFNLLCITGIGPETCNLILQNLRKIKNEYFPFMNKKHDLNLKFTKDDALFGNKQSNFKGFMRVKSVSDIFSRKNKKLKQYHIKLIDDKILNNELSIEDREKEISKIPKFHAHGLRKFFQTTIARNCGNLRICTLMEGHVSPVKTDSSYIQITAEEVKEVYLSALPDLSLSNMETKVYTSDIRREMESKINDLESKNQELESKLDEYSSFEERLRALEENRPSWNEFIRGD